MTTARQEAFELGFLEKLAEYDLSDEQFDQVLKIAHELGMEKEASFGAIMKGFSAAAKAAKGAAKTSYRAGRDAGKGRISSAYNAGKEGLRSFRPAFSEAYDAALGGSAPLPPNPPPPPGIPAAPSPVLSAAASAPATGGSSVAEAIAKELNAGAAASAPSLTGRLGGALRSAGSAAMSPRFMAGTFLGSQLMGNRAAPAAQERETPPQQPYMPYQMGPGMYAAQGW